MTTKPLFPGFDGLMTLGLGVLGLAPAAFWAMTPREMAAALRAIVPDAAAMDRSGLAALMRRHPDI